METQKNQGMKVIQNILGFLMTTAFIFFITGEVMLPAENLSENNTFEIFQADWVNIRPDGTEVPITLPGTCEAEYGEWVTVATTLPENQKSTSFCIRSMQQELKIYVDDELREKYSTLNTQLVGKTSTMAYVFFPIYSSDAGKTLRIELMTASSYSGFVNEIYTGEMWDITRHLFGMYAPGTIVAVLLFLIGILVVCCCWFVRVAYKIDVELLHLGNGILLASTWLIVESKIRQFIFPNSTIAMLMGFLLIAILPYPFLSYINIIQERRYEKAYMTLAILTAINYVVSVVLQLLNIKDFFEIMTSSHIILIGLILTIGITIVLDFIKGHVKGYREVAIGFAVLMFAGICEISLVYVIDTQINGIALCIGLIMLLLSAGLKSIRDLFNAEKEKQIAIAASESKAKFLANMSHEIRTPINAIIGMNEMIMRENRDESIDEYTYNIKNASQMLLSLINDVLDFSKIEAGKLQLVENDYYPSIMLNDVIRGIGVRANQKNLKVKAEIDETMPAVLKGDEIRIKQILNNLLSNAIKYTDEGQITISAKGVRNEGGFYLILAVEDTGIGIKKADIEKLFDSFQRLELSKNRYIEGTGLGLNITKQLVDLMDGTIEVQSEYGIGSCFTVKLPQQIVEEVPIKKLSQKPGIRAVEKASPQEFLSAPEAKILAVDDMKMNLIVIESLLKRSQIQIDFATSGSECLRKTRIQKYDLILMDHMMPEPDGIQTLHMIRDDKNNPNQATEVIVLTANAIAGMKEQYLAEGFADYLTKPIEAEKLEETLAKYLK